ncbi:RagB/SusD family nutrient uptake outer membrane protein [Labilibacter marinus]|uniref:RagB/SusD family nutrient uptake outer membrane protein n=1 Tax=Labilibacter marinus TaxID=1477105 RepID=UPI0008345DA0|nr:RagB/SusD family nutrient uptake outer membrane protein [Labilibacter marinus]
MKKIVNNIFLGLTLCLALALSSCEDFLTQENPNAITTDLYWANPNNLSAGLNSVYNSFKNVNGTLVVDESSRADLQYPDQDRPTRKVLPYYFQTFNNSDNLIKNKWAAYYKGIFRANQVIEAYENVKADLSGDNADRALSVFAQARALRGWFYFSLHNIYNKGAIPLVDFVPIDEAGFHNEIASSEDILKFYREDLEFALANIPADVDENEKGRFTKGACEAILAKSYLYEGNFTEAATRLERVMDYGYALMPDVGSNFTTRDEFNAESILEINYTININQELSGDENLYNNLNGQYGGVGAWGAKPPLSWLVVAYRNDPVDPNDPVNVVSYTDENGNVTSKLRTFSLRTSYSIAMADDDAPSIGYYQAEYPALSAAAFGKTRPAHWRKYTNWDIIDNERNLTPPNLGRSGVNIRLIRLADIYLMYAECQMELGNMDEAIKYINRVRKRSHIILLGDRDAPGAEYNDLSTTYDNDRDVADRLYANIYDEETLRTHLYHIERPLELALEGNSLRNNDLRRWGVKKERFVDLAARRYNIAHIWKNTMTEIGTHKTFWKAVVTEYVEGNEDPDSPNYLPPFNNNSNNGEIVLDGIVTYQSVDHNDLQEAALNYDEDKHAYLPIPLSEINSNLGLKE